jgi:hypothetical protein
VSQDQLVYVYGIAAARPCVTPAGIDGVQVRWIGESGLSAAVSNVPRREFDEKALNNGLTDMHWLGPRAIAHQDVNQQLHEASEALLPLAFGTVFRDDERVEAMLRDEAASLKERLERVRGCSEWVVTVHRAGAPDTAQSAQVRQLQQQIAASSPGRAHLLRKRLADVEREARRDLEQEAIDRVVGALREVAEDVYAEPIPAETLEPPLLRASLLVQRNRVAEFINAVERMQTSWYQAQLTGPWPAYRFAGLEREHAAAAS